MKNIIKLLAVLLLASIALPAVAQQKQKFHIESFSENSFDMSGHEKPTSRDDGTGMLYAIIKVRSTNPDDDLRAYDLDFDYLKDVQEVHDGILWVYVQNGAKTVTVSREGFHTVERYNLRTTLQPGKVYDMKIKPEPKKVTKQMVRFNITPLEAKAVVMYRENVPDAAETVLGYANERGELAKSLPLGTYFYRIISDNCYPSEGVITLDNAGVTHIEEVSLRPNFGRVTFDTEDGVEIFIDEELKGTTPLTLAIKNGVYNIECRKAGFKPSKTTITVLEGRDTTIVPPALTPITGGIAIITDPFDAKVWIDGKEYGITPCNIPEIIIGKHTIRLEKEEYESVEIEVEVIKDETNEQNITLKKSRLQQKQRRANSLSGIVIDKKGNPLAGTKVESTTGGVSTLTDSEGYFSIELPTANYSLTFTKKGMHKKNTKFSTREGNIVTMRQERVGWFATAIASTSINKNRVEMNSATGDTRGGIMWGYISSWGGYMKYTLAPNIEIPYAFALGVTKRVIKPLHVYAGAGYSAINYTNDLLKEDWFENALLIDVGFIVLPTPHLNLNIGCSINNHRYNNIGKNLYSAELQLGVGYTF